MIGELSAISAALCWAVATILYKKALSKVDPLAACLVRTASAAIFLFLLAARDLNSFLHIDPTSLALITAGVILGLAVGDILYFEALSRIAVSLAAPLSSTYPIYAVAFAYLLVHEPVGWGVALGAVVIVFGTWLVSARQDHALEKGRSHRLGILMMLAAAPLWGLSLVIFKVAVLSNDPTQVSALRMLIVSPVLLGALVVSGRGQHLRRIGAKEIATLAVAGVLALGVGGILLLQSLALTDASKTAPLSSTSPLFTVVLALAFLKEKITTRLATGTGLIMLGVGLVSLT